MVYIQGKVGINACRGERERERETGKGGYFIWPFESVPARQELLYLLQLVNSKPRYEICDETACRTQKSREK
jgi:hypothetical protein